MAQHDWKQYFFVVFDITPPRATFWFRSRADARQSAKVARARGVKVVGIGRVRGKVPEVQQWFAANALLLV